MSPDAVTKLLERERRTAEVEKQEIMERASAALAKTVGELRGALLVNYVLVKRLGGEVIITPADIDAIAPTSFLRLSRDTETGDTILTCVDEPDDAAPEDMSDDSDGYARIDTE